MNVERPGDDAPGKELTMRVQDLMTRNVECARPQTDLAAVAMTMWRKNCGIVPVLDDARHVVGVITDRDICMAVSTRHRRPEELTAQDVMSGKVTSVLQDDDVHVALDAMGGNKVRRLPVVDAEGRIQGLISMNDLVLRAQPAGRPTPQLSANEVLVAMQRICEHQAATEEDVHREELVAVHT